MKKIDTYSLYYYDLEVIKKISEKYGLSPMQSFIDFVNSETYKMLEDNKYWLLELGTLGLFDMWENERITGNPRNSIYIRNK